MSPSALLRSGLSSAVSSASSVARRALSDPIDFSRSLRRTASISPSPLMTAGLSSGVQEAIRRARETLQAARGTVEQSRSFRQGGGIGGFTSAIPQTPSPQRSMQDYQALIDRITQQVRVPTRVLTLGDVGFGADAQSRARQIAAERVGRVLNPQLTRGLQNIGGNFAERGIFRSGMRQNEQGRFRDDIEEQRAIQQEELYNIREQEARQKLAREQARLEKEAAQSQQLRFSELLKQSL